MTQSSTAWSDAAKTAREVSNLLPCSPSAKRVLALVVERGMADEKEALTPEVLRLLKRYLDNDEEDRRAGRTREHHEKMLQRVIDAQNALKLDMTKSFGSVDNQFTSMRLRVENVEARVGKLEGKVEDVEETTGNFQVEGLKDYKKTSQKWMFLFFAAALTVVVTVVSAWLIAKAQIENAAPKSDPKELIK